MFFTTNELDQILLEDTPYFDLTAHLLNIDHGEGTISYFIRESATISGLHLVKQLFHHLQVETTFSIESGVHVEKDTVLITGKGDLKALYRLWKVCQNVLEYGSAIATKTSNFVQAAHSLNPALSILTTRKQFPLTKKIAIQAILDGGAYPHRLGVSETILIFDKHIEILGGLEKLLLVIPNLKQNALEKKILVEYNEINGILALCEAGVDGIQLDKLPAKEIELIAKKVKSKFPKVMLLVAGGINMSNVQEYAQCSIDGIVTTSLYSAPPLNIGVQIQANE